MDYYTPEMWTKVLLSSLSSTAPSGILDAAVGNGALLGEATRRFPGAGLFGIDIDRTAIAHVRRKLPGALLSVADSLKEASIRRTKVWARRSSIDTMVANPPFNVPDGRRSVAVDAWGQSVRVGVAAAHLLTTIASFGPREVAAIVPSSLLHSERDAVAVELLKRRYRLERLRRLGRLAFRVGAAATEVVRLTALALGQEDLESEEEEVEGGSHRGPRAISIGLVRGRLPVHLAVAEKGEGGVPFVHTSNIATSGEMMARVRKREGGVIRGMSILLPRVGAVVRERLRTREFEAPVQLSDCVIALCFDGEDAARDVLEKLCGDFASFVECWAGTGAPYTTVGKIRRYLAEVGVDAMVLRNWGDQSIAMDSFGVLNGSALGR